MRATGSAVSDLVRVAGTPDVWEIRFQRGIIGETDAQIEYQGQSARSQGERAGADPGLHCARSRPRFTWPCGPAGASSWPPPTVPRGWQPLDWSAVPDYLQDRADRSVPALCYSVAEPEGPLVVAVQPPRAGRCAEGPRHQGDHDHDLLAARPVPDERGAERRGGRKKHDAACGCRTRRNCSTPSSTARACRWCARMTPTSSTSRPAPARSTRPRSAWSMPCRKCRAAASISTAPSSACRWRTSPGASSSPRGTPSPRSTAIGD